MGLVVRLRPNGEPVVEIQAANLGELDATLRSMRAQGVWSALKGAAREFTDAPLAGVEAVVLELIPGTQQIGDVDKNAPTESQVDLAAEAAQLEAWNDGAVERAKANGFPEADLKPPKQVTPKCKTCGASTTFASGTGKNGAWSAYFCTSGNREHTSFIK